MEALNKIFMILAYVGIILFVVGIFTLISSVIATGAMAVLVGIAGGVGTLEEE